MLKNVGSVSQNLVYRRLEKPEKSKSQEKIQQVADSNLSPAVEPTPPSQSNSSLSLEKVKRRWSLNSDCSASKNEGEKETNDRRSDGASSERALNSSDVSESRQTDVGADFITRDLTLTNSKISPRPFSGSEDPYDDVFSGISAL